MSAEYRVSPKSPEILKEVATELCSAFHIESEDPLRDECIDILSGVLENSGDGDGYYMAKRLDTEYGWDVNEGDVEALSAAHSRLSSLAHQKSSQKIKELGVVPRFTAGNVVSWKRWNKLRTGTIVSVLPTEMSYHIPIIEDGKKIEYFVNDEDLTRV
jgi:hypothetical protein